MKVNRKIFPGSRRGLIPVLFLLVTAWSIFLWPTEGDAANLILFKGSTVSQRNIDTLILLPDGFPMVAQDLMNACRKISHRNTDILAYDISGKKCDRYENLTIGNLPEPADSVLSGSRRYYGGNIFQLMNAGYFVFYEAASGTASCVSPVARMVCPPPAAPANRPPIANAGGDQTYEATSSLGASVVLNGAGSTDPEGDPLTYSWSGPFGTVSGGSPSVALGLGIHTIVLTVTDTKGATGNDTAIITVQDTTPPSAAWTLNPTPNGAGWNNMDVTVAFTATDTVSLASCTPSSVKISTEGAGQVAHAVCTDESGNQTAANVTINIDKTSPVVGFEGSCPATAGLNATVALDVSVSDALSGVGFQSVPNGLNTFIASVAGSNSFTVTARDNAGNQGSNTCVSSVLYEFMGFKPPLDNPPAVNKGKAGRVIPIKWQIPDGNGGFISDLGIVRSIQFQQVACQNYGDINELPVDADVSGSSGLHYDPVANQFSYNWQTAKSGAGKCFVLILKLNDGSEHRANVSLQ